MIKISSDAVENLKNYDKCGIVHRIEAVRFKITGLKDPKIRNIRSYIPKSDLLLFAIWALFLKNEWLF